MFANMNGWHLAIVLVVLLLLFGATRLPGLAKGLGQSMRILRSEVGTAADEPVEEEVGGDGTGRDGTAGEGRSTSSAPSRRKRRTPSPPGD